MSKIERRPLPPVGKRSGSISPEDVQAYANDLLREAWEGPQSYHPDGGLRDFDDRIEGLDRAIDELLALEQRIPPSPGRPSRYLTERFLPDKAIDLMDEAGSKVKLTGSPQPSEISESRRKIKTIVDRMETAIQKKEFEKAAFYRDEEMLQRENLFMLKEKLDRHAGPYQYCYKGKHHGSHFEMDRNSSEFLE